MNPAITVFCSSCTGLAPAYLDAGRALGDSIARRGWSLVYGGNRIGLMGVVADAARAAGGRVIGVSPQAMVDEGIGDSLCDELVVTPCMRTRKHQLEQRGDAFIALPGGLGTYEELFEIIVGRVLGYHQKPIVILNVAGYYAPLLAMIKHSVEQGFVREKAMRSFMVADDPAAAIAMLQTAFIVGKAP